MRYGYEGATGKHKGNRHKDQGSANEANYSYVATSLRGRDRQAERTAQDDRDTTRLNTQANDYLD